MHRASRREGTEMTSSYESKRDLKILVVDDFPTQRKLIRRSLLALGFENVKEAIDGMDALEKLHREEFELIICDWNMPKMPGIDLLRAVRADEKLKETPFLMVTAEARRENIIEAARAGVTNYIAKPFTVESLQEKMEDILSE
jgi:two-component system chemotaxis response regulator CheY